MSRRCEICGKGSTKGAKRSHSNIKTLKRQHRNLQTKNIGGRKLKICTKCLKTLSRKAQEVVSEKK
ncbi:MAG TPA: 50S ribosomal protein L28 [Patescibacteria group bacterium]|nr:50S ribosomal protein L28 [Patescibacteria group bacterium]